MATFLERSSTAWAVALLIAVLFSLTNLPWTLDDYDQAKQAFTSFEMVHEGHWLYQRTPTDRIATKPPLIGWISAATYGVTRWWDGAWRLPSLAAAVALALVLWREGRKADGESAGLLAASAFGLNLLSPRLATLVRTDMPLALVITLIGLLIWKKVRAAAAWNRGDRLTICVLLTAAMLIKGPIVYAFLLPGLTTYQIAAWKRGEAANAWCGWWPWLVSLGVFLLWAFGGILLVPGFYEQVVLREFAGRFGQTVHHPQPFLFYLPHLLHRFFPWSVLLIGVAIVRARASETAPRAWFRRIEPGTLWLLCWSVGGLLVMSLIPSKRVDRIFPIVPPLCLLLSALAAGLAGELRVRVWRWCAVSLLTAAVCTGSYGVLHTVTDYGGHRDELKNFVRAAAAKYPRIEAIYGGDEGVLLYLERPRFLGSEEATRAWNDHALDALIVPEDSSLVTKLPALPQAGPPRYVLLTRPE